MRYVMGKKCWHCYYKQEEFTCIENFTVAQVNIHPEDVFCPRCGYETMQVYIEKLEHAPVQSEHPQPGH